MTYDLPPHLVGVAFHGKYRGQRQKWFAMRFTGKDSDIDLHAHEPEFSDWKWLAIEELPRLIVPFKRDSYAKVMAPSGIWRKARMTRRTQSRRS